MWVCNCCHEPMTWLEWHDHCRTNPDAALAGVRKLDATGEQVVP